MKLILNDSCNIPVAKQFLTVQQSILQGQLRQPDQNSVVCSYSAPQFPSAIAWNLTAAGTSGHCSGTEG